MGFFSGVDLGKRKSQSKVLAEDRKVVESVKIENDAKAFTGPSPMTRWPTGG